MVFAQIHSGGMKRLITCLSALLAAAPVAAEPNPSRWIKCITEIAGTVEAIEALSDRMGKTFLEEELSRLPPNMKTSHDDAAQAAFTAIGQYLFTLGAICEQFRPEPLP